MHKGGCHCGAIRYEAQGEPLHHALCHCMDCRRHVGAPIVGWAMFRSDQVRVTQGAAKAYASSAHGRGHFCTERGTSLYYTNAEMLPGITDIQSATLDEPALIPAQVHIQTGDRIDWMNDAHTLPAFERYPPPA